MKKNKILLIKPTIMREGIEILEKEVDLIYAPDGSEKTLIKYIIDVDALIVRVEHITASIIEASKQLKVIAEHGVGIDNIDVQKAKEKGIIVINAPNANYVSVAEHVVMFVLSLSKNVLRADKAVRNGYWNFRNEHIPQEIDGKNFFCIGFGKTGQKTCQTLKSAFNMNIFFYDPYISQEEAKNYGVQKIEDLYKGLKLADFVSLHLPYNKYTHHLISTKEFNFFKEGSSFLINCARGPIVDSKALYNALKSGKIKGVGLDVFEKEPPDVSDKLIELDNVILTPHFAGDTIESKKRCSKTIATEVLSILKGNKPKFAINHL